MISRKQVEHIAELARLKLEEEELKKMERDLSLVLDYFDVIQKIDVSNAEPFFYLQGQKNIVRKDEVKSFEGDKAIQAPEKKDGYLKVKGVF